MQSYSAPISIKGIIFEDDKVWLRKNERDEWELPGGKLEDGEQPEQAVVRELREELGFETDVVAIAQAHLYTIRHSIDESHGVLVVTYLCKIRSRIGDFEIDGEAGTAQFERFFLDEVAGLNMPEFYKGAIQIAVKMRNNERL